METLTAEEREALFTDMRSFDPVLSGNSTISDESTGLDEPWGLGHGWSGDMPR